MTGRADPALPERTSAAPDPRGSEAGESQAAVQGKLNWLRAGVLGANDGVVSTASIIFGVAGGTDVRATILLAGIAAIAAGALSMAVGEYVSVSSQRDIERSALERERRTRDADPQATLARLEALLVQRGIDPATATRAARELDASQGAGAIASVELGLDADAVVSPLQAAAASMLAFSIGGLIPLLAIIVAYGAAALRLAALLVMLALAASGAISAWLGCTPAPRAILRTVAGGLIAMLVTFGIGHLVGRAL